MAWKCGANIAGRIVCSGCERGLWWPAPPTCSLHGTLGSSAQLLRPHSERACWAPWSCNRNCVCNGDVLRSCHGTRFQNDEHHTSPLHKLARLSPQCCRSLCIIDEFGKGTLTADGVGLLCATLSAFAERTDPPRVVACTHFSEVLKHQYLPRQGRPK